MSLLLAVCFCDSFTFKTRHPSLQKGCQWNMGERSLHLDLHHPYPASFLFLQHKSSQENNKQMSRMGTAPRESIHTLRQARITPLVPRLKARGQARAWFPIHYQELEKLVINHRYLSLLFKNYYAPTHFFTSLDTDRETEIKTTHLTFYQEYSSCLAQYFKFSDKHLPVRGVPMPLLKYCPLGPDSFTD